MAGLTYAGKLVRQMDYDRYLLSLFAPAGVRPYLWALYAFNYEISRTRDVVTDTHMGLIRLQWWRDEIARIYLGEGCVQNEILPVLAKAIYRWELPQEWFDRLLFAREFDLEDKIPENLAGVYNYADFTTTPLTQLALKMLQIDGDYDIIRSISADYGVIRVIRSVPYLLSQRRSLLPEDLLLECGCNVENLFDYNQKTQISEAIRKCIDGIRWYNKEAGGFLGKQKALTSIYLKDMRKAGFDIFSPKAQVRQYLLPLRLLVS